MNAPRSYHIHVSAKESKTGLNLKEVWRYRDLIWLFTKRTFKLIYKQTVLGPLWIVLSPFLTSIVYTAVFGNIAGLSTGGVPKLLFYLCSHSFWLFFADCLNKNSATFLSQAAVYSKVYFPRLTVPVSTVLSAGIQFLIHLLMTALILLYYVIRGQVTPDVRLLPLLPLLLLLTGAMGLGVGILISSVTTRYRDLSFLVGFGLQLWMYASPVVYPVSQLSDGFLYRLLLINPMTAPMELFRLALLGIGDVSPVSVCSTLVFSVLAFVCGILHFNKVERNFIDTV